MQYNLPALATFLVDSVLNAADDNMNGAQLMQIIGLLAIIVKKQQSGEIATSIGIARDLGLAAGVVNKNVQWLEKKEIIKRTPVTSAIGRGRTYKITLHETHELRILLGLDT